VHEARQGATGCDSATGSRPAFGYVVVCAARRLHSPADQGTAQREGRDILRVAMLGTGQSNFYGPSTQSWSRNVETMMIEIGIDSFAATIPDPATGKTLPAADP
jgi:hypothetical protein